MSHFIENKTISWLPDLPSKPNMIVLCLRVWPFVVDSEECFIIVF